MKRVYEYFTTFTNEQSWENKHRISDFDLDFILSLECIEMYFDGEKYTSEADNNSSLSIITCTEDEINQLKAIDFKLHHDIEGYTTVTDITDDVLMGVYDCDKYDFAKELVIDFLYEWRKIYLEQDDILDKINKYGIDSLTQQEKDYLETGILNNPFKYESADN